MGWPGLEAGDLDARTFAAAIGDREPRNPADGALVGVSVFGQVTVIAPGINALGADPS